MGDPDSTSESVEVSKEELEQRISNLEDKANGSNRISMRAYDIQIQANSEEATMDELAEICSEQMDDMMRKALVGEYQEIERQDLFGAILGDD